MSGRSDRDRLVLKSNVIRKCEHRGWRLRHLQDPDPTPTANQFGTATITVTVTDGTTNTVRTFTVTVNAVNDAPTLNESDQLDAG